ncbi:MAG: response regulator [Pseudomonadota bacterium]
MKQIKLSVLVIEDNPVLLSFWERILSDMGIPKKSLHFTSDVLEAKALLSKYAFDLLISDVVLPDLNGYQLARFAIEKNPGIRILLTTGYSANLSRFDLKGLKAHLIHKPYQDLNRLTAMISHVINDEDPFEDATEDSHSENDFYPDITEWSL